MTPQHEADLSWFFSGEAEAAVSGLRSPALEWSPGGGDSDADDKAIARLDVTRRHRRVSQALGRCSPVTRAVLRAHYGRRRWATHPEIPARLGHLAGVVVYVARYRAGPGGAVPLALSLDQLVRLLVRGTTADREALTRLRAEATLVLREAHFDYCQSAPNPLRFSKGG